MLNTPTLVLNKMWMPVDVTTVRDALCKLFEGRAKAVTDDYDMYDFESWAELALTKDEPYISTSRSHLKVPSVIVLTTYDKMPTTTVVFSRMNIYRRDEFTCQYCEKKRGSSSFTIDHVIPRSRGGKSTWTNCVLACWECNAKKADKMIAQSGMKLKREPVKPEWTPRMVLRRVKNTPENWKKFINDAYWNVELKD